MEIVSKYWIVLLLGLLLRLIITAFTFHPDVKTPALSSAVFFQQKSLDFYSQSPKLAPAEVLDDLPLGYLISLPVHLLGRWLVSPGMEKVFLSEHHQLFGQSQLMLYLLYTKLPLIIFDLGLAILLVSLVAPQTKGKVLKLWIFNPMTLWATAAIGQFDVYPTFFMILALSFVLKSKLNWAALSLGAGGAIKFAPFLLLPFLLGLASSYKQRIILIVVASLPYLLTVIPYLPSWEFRQNALFAPQLEKSFFAKIPLSGGESIFLTTAVLSFLYFFYLIKKHEAYDFLRFSLASLLATLSLTHFHIQWFLWVMPFLLIWLLDNWKEGVPLVFSTLFLSLLLMFFLFEASLQVKLLAPLLPGLDQAFGLAEILSSAQITLLRGLAASIFAASSVFLILKILKTQ